MWRKRTFSELSTESDQRQGRLPVVLLLHNIRSQYNVGAIMRTADAVGVQKVILSGYTPLPEQKGVQKTALRGLTGVQWEYQADPMAVLEHYKKLGFTRYGLEQCHESVAYDRCQYTFPILFVLGEEVHGVADSVLAYCDHVVEIPMFGKAHSLNVSVAAGVVLYKLLEMQRKISE